MPNLLNQLMLEEYRRLARDASDCVFVDPQGLSVQEARDLRQKLREGEIRMNVVKNSLVALAYREGGLDGLDAILPGPTAVVYGDGVDAVVHAAKLLEEWHKKSGKKKPEVKGGILEGEVLDSDRAAGLARLPTRAESKGRIAAALLSPGQRIAAAVSSPGARIAGALEAMVEKLEGGDPEGGE